MDSDRRPHYKLDNWTTALYHAGSPVVAVATVVVLVSSSNNNNRCTSDNTVYNTSRRRLVAVGTARSIASPSMGHSLVWSGLDWTEQGSSRLLCCVQGMRDPSSIGHRPLVAI